MSRDEQREEIGANEPRGSEDVSSQWARKVIQGSLQAECHRFSTE